MTSFKALDTPTRAKVQTVKASGKWLFTRRMSKSPTTFINFNLQHLSPSSLFKFITYHLEHPSCSTPIHHLLHPAPSTHLHHQLASLWRQRGSQGPQSQDKLTNSTQGGPGFAAHVRGTRLYRGHPQTRGQTTQDQNISKHTTRQLHPKRFPSGTRSTY